MIEEAIHRVLSADSDVTTGLATYVFTTGGLPLPAIFTMENPPKNAVLPAVCIHGPIGGARWGTREKKGAEVLVDVSLWGDKSRSTLALGSLAWRIWEALERAELQILGYEEVGCMATPPRALRDPDGFPGYQVEVRVRILQT